MITIRDFARVTTARVPKRDALDIFAPEVEGWAYEGSPQRALRALLELVHPEHPDAPERRLSRTREPARSPGPPTPHDDPPTRTRSGPRAG